MKRRNRLSAKPHVIIYTKPGCHLCDEAKLAIQKASCEGLFTQEEINIQTAPDLIRQYQYDIPVITIDGVEAFRHRLTPEEFRKRLGCGSLNTFHS
jgi:glutaredoxin